MVHRGRQIKDASGTDCEDGLAQDGRCVLGSCTTHRARSDGFRVRGWDHEYWQDLNHQVGLKEAVPPDKLGCVVRALFKDGAVKVEIEYEEFWAAAERGVEEEDAC